MYRIKRIAAGVTLTLAQIYTVESMRNRPVVDALDGRAYVTLNMAVESSHKQASMTDPSLDWAEHAFGTTCWDVRGTNTQLFFGSA